MSVLSFHVVEARGEDVSAFFKSAGNSCTTPLEIFFCDIDKLSFRKPQRREDLLLSKGCGSFGYSEVLTLRLTRRVTIHCGRVTDNTDRPFRLRTVTHNVRMADDIAAI